MIFPQVPDRGLQFFIEFPAFPFIAAPFRHERVKSALLVEPAPFIECFGGVEPDFPAWMHDALLCCLSVVFRETGISIRQAMDDRRYHAIAHQRDRLFLFLLHTIWGLLSVLAPSYQLLRSLSCQAMWVSKKVCSLSAEFA